MIRVITTRRLAALQSEAAQVPELRDRVAAAQEQLRRAEVARDEVTDDLQRLYDAVVTDLAELKRMADDPATGARFQADFALKFVREQIAKVKETGDIEAINRLWLLDIMINRDADAAATPERAS